MRVYSDAPAVGGCVAALMLVTALAVAACSPGDNADGAATVSGGAPESFGTLPDGRDVGLFRLTNANGLQVRAIEYGAILQSIEVPDRHGELADIALGYDTLDGYLGDSPYFGAVVGRYANRIAAGRFSIDGTVSTLATNNDTNHLHGGDRGFDKVLWRGEALGTNEVAFAYRSPDGEEGYPGALDVTVTYRLTDDDELVVDYHAVADAPTPVNLTQHTYFNMAASGDILGHELRINADRYTPVDATLIPTGELSAVADTPFDFTTAAAIGARIDADHVQLRHGGGYDHNFVLNIAAGTGIDAPIHAAHVVEPSSGRVLDVYTSEPGIQLYSGNFLDGSQVGKGGRRYTHRSGFCLETQHFPDSPNQPSFPTTIVRPGMAYRTRTTLRFSASAPAQ